MPRRPAAAAPLIPSLAAFSRPPPFLSCRLSGRSSPRDPPFTCKNSVQAPCLYPSEKCSTPQNLAPLRHPQRSSWAGGAARSAPGAAALYPTEGFNRTWRAAAQYNRPTSFSMLAATPSAPELTRAGWDAQAELAIPFHWPTVSVAAPRPAQPEQVKSWWRSAPCHQPWGRRWLPPTPRGAE